MVERNLIVEGFVYNTLTPLGTISGSQTVSPGEMILLADGDIATTALVASGSEFISLDADLGARFKIDRIELYTNEASSANLYVWTSDDEVAFSTVTMTGSAGLYVSDHEAFLTTSGGAPRYIRYEHRPLVDRNVQEWKIVSDGTLVDFGSDGTQTELEIADAPIGRPSDYIEPLTLFNNFTKVADSFVFVDRTDNDAEEQIEVALGPSGPWYGKGTSVTTQPDRTEWIEGLLTNTRIVSTGTLGVNWEDGDDHGWVGFNATVSTVDGVLRGNSTTTSPRLQIENNFEPFRSDSFPDTEETFYQDYFSFRAADADRVRVRLKVSSTVSPGDLVEGAKLFWRTEQEEAGASVFRSGLSTFPIGGDRPPSGKTAELVFDVGSVPTWSGTVRGFAVQPLVTATGTGYVFDLVGLEVYDTAGDHIAVDFRPVTSGTFPDDGVFTLDSTITSASEHRTILPTHTTVMQDCIITKVRAVTYLAPAGPIASFFLARPQLGTSFPSPGTNFEIPYATRVGEDIGLRRFIELDVFWPAQAGDIVGYSTGVSTAAGVNYSTTDGNDGDSWNTSTNQTTSSLAGLESTLNASTWASKTHHYMLAFDAIPNGLPRKDGQSPYYTTGTYRTPVFDGGSSPALTQLDFDSVEPVGTSIDTVGASGFRTVRARASGTPARTSLALGEVGTVSGTSETLFFHINDAASVGTSVSDLQINTNNDTMAALAGGSVTAVNNFAGALLYHEQNDELWALNCIISGTASFEARPSWDVLSPHTGSYVETRHVTGALFYSYLHPGEDAGFEPVGFVADYDREELYLFQREDAFYVGAGTYHGLVLNLDGSFKDVFWRSDTVGADLNRLETVIGFTYAPEIQDTTYQDDISGVFFTLNNSTASKEQGTLLTAYRNGNDDDLRQVEFVNEVSLVGIPGLEWLTNPPDARGVVFNETTGYLVVLIDTQQAVNATATKDDPVFYNLSVTYNNVSDVFEYAVVSSGIGSPRIARNVSGYLRENAGTGPDWSGEELRFSSVISPEGIGFTTGMAHVLSRDTLAVLRTYTATRTEDYPSDNSPGHFDSHNHSFIAECGAGSSVTFDLPKAPQEQDPLWGTAAGTLQFEDISTEGVNFPTGRFAQVEYQLNVDVANTASPQLTKSQLSQGVRTGTIAPGGTRDIYVRTNIPDGQEIGDQAGRLKVLWETEEE